jgi:hypothetical protein
MRMCNSCRERPVRKRYGLDQSDLYLCLACADVRGFRIELDTEPEPEGFADFVKLVIGGPG